MSASCSSSELSSHQMAIRSHPGLQKMPASGISSELSAHQMAPAGAIAHSKTHLCPRASSFSFSSSVSPLRPLGLGLLARGDPRSFTSLFVRRYGRRSGQPSSSSLARRPASTYCRFRLLVLQFTSTSTPRVRLLGHPEVRKRPWPLQRPRGDGNGGRFVRSPCLPSWRGLRLYAIHQMLSLGPCAATVQRTVGESVTTLPAKTQGRTLDCPFNFRPPRIVAGWVFYLCRRDPLA